MGKSTISMAIFNSNFDITQKIRCVSLKIEATDAVGVALASLGWCRNSADMAVSENVVYPCVPNGFADQTIPFLNGYFIGKINPIFRQTHI